MRKIMISILTMMMVIGLMVSCDNTNAIPEQKVEELVSISFNEGTSRGLTGSIEAFNKNSYYWKYAAKKTDDSGLISGQTPSYDAQGAVWVKKGTEGKSAGKGLDVSIGGFSQGYWKFTLYAYTDDNGTNLAYSGEITGQKLQKNETNNIVVTVAPISTGNGTLLVDTTKISLVPNQNNSLTPEQLATFAKEVIVESFVDGHVSSTPFGPIEVNSTEYNLPAGTYKVTVKFVRNDNLTYAEGSAIATVYSNVKTIVSGYLDEITTEAKFDSDAEVINKVAVTDYVNASSIETAITSDVTLKDDPTDAVVIAEVPQNDAKTQLQNAVNNSAYKDIGNAVSREATLQLKVDTTSATNSSVTLEIGMSSIVKTVVPPEQVGEENIVYEESTAIKELENYVTVTVQLQTHLENVFVKHNGLEMQKLDSVGETITNENGAFHYNAESGILTIKTKKFSPFEVLYDPVRYVVSMNGNQYSSLAGAVADIPENTGTTEIKLISNASGNGVKVPEGSNIIFDLNGYTFNIDGTTVGSTGTETNGFQLLKNSTIVIKNGTITSDKAKILIQNYSNLTLDNVVLDGTNLLGNNPYTLSNNNGNTVINNSTIKAKDGGVAFDVYSFGSYTGTTVTIRGTSIINGKIEVGRSNNAPLSLTVEEGGTLSADSISINENLDNNTFNVKLAFDPEAYLDGNYVIDEGDMYTVKHICAEYNSTNYASVMDAVKARGTSGSIKTITLMKNVNEDITLKGYTKLDLNGNTITGDITIKDYDSLYNGTVNGTVTDITKTAPSNNDKNGIYNCTVTKFVLADGCNRENVTIENSTIGEVIVGNRYYSSGSAGLLTFKDSHVTGNITVGSQTIPYSGSMGSGWGYGSKVRFLGGTYEGTITLSDPNTYNNKIDIVTGVFTNNVNNDFLNSGSAVKVESGKYVVYKLPVAQVDQTYYDTIEDACAAAMAGENHTVTVLVDGNVETTVEVTGDLVFDLNGHTVQAAPPNNRAFYIKENGHLTINDSSEAKTGLLESISSSNAETIYFKEGNSSLTVNGGTIKSLSKPIAADSTVKSPYSITINGGIIWSTNNTVISLNANAPVDFRMNNGELKTTGNYVIYTGTYGTGTHTFTFTGGTYNCASYWYDLYISTGGGVNTVVNIASGVDIRCSTGNGITVNNDYSE